MARGKGRTDISHGRRDANLDTRVSFLCQLTLEELIQFGIKDAVCHKLPSLRNRRTRYRSHDCGAIRAWWLTKDFVDEMCGNC